ncbi:hypothetical protein V1281_001904 [Nitrobacteraceae bacterium AZCC 2161]
MFKLSVRTDGPGFGEAEHSRRAAIVQVLQNLAVEIGSGRPASPIRDAGGIEIGNYEITDGEDL